MTTPAPALERDPEPTARARTSWLATGTSRLASWRIVLGSGAALVLFAVVLFTSSAPFSIPHVEAACGAAPPDVRPFTSASGVHAFLDACGPAGTDAYRNLQLADLVYPFVVGLFLASALAVVLRRLFPSRPRLAGVAAIAILVSGFDYVENAAAWGALAAYPGTSPAAWFLGPASAAKTATSWVAVATFVLAVLALAVVEVRARLSRGSRSAGTVE